MSENDDVKYYVKDPLNKLVEVIDVWESFSGWYWFITEKESTEIETDEGSGIVAYGLVIGLEAEWGEIWMPELEDLKRKNKVWPVEKMNWSSISHIITKRQKAKEEIIK